MEVSWCFLVVDDLTFSLDTNPVSPITATFSLYHCIQLHDHDGEWNMSAIPLVPPQLTTAIVAESDRGIAKNGATPVLSHRLKHDKSILALVVSANCIFAGTEGGEILVIDAFSGRELSLTNCLGV